MIYGLVIGAIAGLVTRALLIRHMRRSRQRVWSLYVNSDVAALCSPSRNGVITQDAYKDWIEQSEKAWAERAERHEAMRKATVSDLRKSLGLPDWDGVPVEMESLVRLSKATTSGLMTPEQIRIMTLAHDDPIPAPSIFTQQEINDD